MTAEREPAERRDAHRLRTAVAGTPVPWKRPASGNRKHTSRHDAYLAWREQIGWIVDAERKRQRLPQPMAAPFEGASLTLTFLGAPIAADIDNLAKAVLDALQGICYVDDSQVAELAVSRHPQSFGARGVLLTVMAPVVLAHPWDAVERLADSHSRYGGAP